MIVIKTTMNEFEKYELQERMEEDCLSQEVIIIAETGRIKEMKGESRGEFLFAPRHFKSIRRVIMLKESGNIYKYAFDWEASEKVDYTHNVKVEKVQVDWDVFKETIREEFFMGEDKIYIDCTEDELDINAKVTDFKENDKYIEYEYKMLNWEAIISQDSEDDEDCEDDEWI